MSYDSATWLAAAGVLTGLGLVLSWSTWQRRGVAPALRAVAWSLLPMALWATGTLELLVKVAGAGIDWASHLVLSPLVWVGIALAGLSVLLFGVSGAMKARGVGVRNEQRRAAQRAQGDERPRSVGRQPSQPEAQANRGKPKKGADEGLDDDIEAILRRHGIQ